MIPRILIADDHPYFRKGLRIFLQQEGYNLLLEASSLDEIIESLKYNYITHAIFDIAFKDGEILEKIESIRLGYPDLKILILSMERADVYHSAFRKLGISHYIQKDHSEKIFVRETLNFLSNETSFAKNEKNDNNPFSRLTPTELQVLGLILCKQSTDQIAKRLTLKNNTVSTFKKRICEKTNLNNILEVYQLAKNHNITYDSLQTNNHLEIK